MLKVIAKKILKNEIKERECYVDWLEKGLYESVGALHRINFLLYQRGMDRALTSDEIEIRRNISDCLHKNTPNLEKN